MGFGILLRLDGLIDLILILYRPFSIREREPYFDDFIWNKMNVGFRSDMYTDRFLLNSTDTTDQLWRSQLKEKSKSSALIFSQVSQSTRMK